MRLITSTGFFNTGSSVVTDIFREFDEIEAKGGVNEIRLLYDADCISDLDYNLIEVPHRHNTSNAIKKFKKFVDFYSNPLFDSHYEKIFNGKFKILSYKYIDGICDFKYKGSYYGDSYNRGKLFWFLERVYQKTMRHLFSKRKLPSFLKRSLLPLNEISFAGTFSEEKFLRETHNYISELLKIYSSGNEYILIDQFLPPTNIERYIKYIPNDIDVKIFIIDRDPIDLYLQAKYFYKFSVIPFYDVNTFCDWYLWTRGQSYKFDLPNNVLRLSFEDFIYNYEETRNLVCAFAGIDINSKCRKFKYFNPTKSINNTQVSERLPNLDKKEISIIKTRLASYCYDFSKYAIKPNYSESMFDC